MADDQPPVTIPAAPSSAQYTITMGGSQFSVALYGIVEYLRANQWMRVLFTVLTIMVTFVSILSLSGSKLFGAGLLPSPFLAAVIVPWMLWAATVSGPNFKLVFGTAKASKEREQAEQQFAKSAKPEDAVTLDLLRLNEYYVINQNQARSSFRWAIFSMLVGFATIIAGVWFFYFHAAVPDKLMAGLSTAAGVVVNIISGVFLHLHTKTQIWSLYYYQQLAAMQKLSMAIRLAEAHQDTDQQKDARNLVIKELLAISHDVASHQPPTGH